MFNSNGNQTADVGPMSPPEDEPVWCGECGGLHEEPVCEHAERDHDADYDLDREDVRPDDEWGEDDG